MRARALLAALTVAAAVRAQSQRQQLPPPGDQKRSELTIIAPQTSKYEGDVVTAEGDVHAQF